MRGRRLPPAGVVALALMAAAAWLLWPPERLDGALRFTSIDGQSFTLAQLRGRPVLVNFWATDCPACVAEIPDLLALHQRYHPLGLAVIAITMRHDPPSHVVAFSKARQLPYPVVLDWRGDHARAFGNVSLTPTTFLIDGDGRIVRAVTGAFAVDELAALIERQLGARPPSQTH